MEKYKITKKDYDNLYAGKVKYLVACYDNIGYGWIGPDWFQVLGDHFRSLFGRKHKFRYQRYMQYYCIATYVGHWNDDDNKAFINEKGLHDGDFVTKFDMYPLDDGTGNLCYGGGDYLVVGDEWILVNKYIGE